MSTTVVSAIVPARNEAANIVCAVRSLAAQEEIGEVIIVDDQSTDATPRLLAELAAAEPKLRVLCVEALPPGWVGKNHAAWLGAQGARGPWLLFTDADTEHLPGSSKRALALAAQHSASLVSFSPQQETTTFWERVLIPFVYCRLAARYPYERVNNPALPDAAANGQFLMIHREAYDSVGGHAAVRDNVLEDVGLASRVKRAGVGIHFSSDAGMVRTRMYRSFGQMWEGWAKNLYPLVRHARAGVVAELVAACGWPFWLALILAVIPGAGAVVLGGAALAREHLLYTEALEDTGYPRSRVVYYLPASILYAAVLLASAWRHKRGRVVWKGREYSVGAP